MELFNNTHTYDVEIKEKYDYVHNFNSGFAFNRVSIFIAKLLGKKVITETSLVGMMIQCHSEVC